MMVLQEDRMLAWICSGLMIIMLTMLPETRGRSLADLEPAPPAAIGGDRAALGGGSS
jgi:hypothetical protein